jgi:hypothetical protein
VPGSAVEGGVCVPKEDVMGVEVGSSVGVGVGVPNVTCRGKEQPKMTREMRIKAFFILQECMRTIITTLL